MPAMLRPTAAVIGGGPAGLMAAERLSASGLAVTVYDQMPTLGRKFLMAGRGGLNLTHSEPIERFLDRYGAARPFLESAIRRFGPDDLVRWCHDLGQETFIGSSGRIFPRAMKASPLLRAWLARLRGSGVSIATRHRWTGFSGQDLCFETPEGAVTRAHDVAVCAAGGASWPRLGSDGSWAAALRGFAVTPLRPANCGFLVGWSARLRQAAAGMPLKRIAATAGRETVRGEAVITDSGIEGGVIYALGRELLDAIARDGSAGLTIDLRPDLTLHELERRLSDDRRGQSISKFLRKSAGLGPASIALLQEALHSGGETLPLAALIKAVTVQLTAPFPIDRAISTAGGLAFTEVDETLMLRRKPGVFAAGEMLDWDAPTGGYLLQACMATGAAAGQAAAAWALFRDRSRGSRSITD